jgi:hypothetical protein
MAEVRTGVHVFAICVKTGIIFKMRNTFFSCIGTEHLRHQFINLFDNISDGDIKVLFFNITQKFTNLLVQLSVTTQVVINQQFIRYNQVHSASVLASDHHACQPGVTPIRKV